MALRVAAPGLKKGSVGEKNVDRALLSIVDINRSAGVHRDAGGVAQARVFKGKERSALGLKFVNKSGGWVGKEKIAQRVNREGNWAVELSRAVALVAPRA